MRDRDCLISATQQEILDRQTGWQLPQAQEEAWQSQAKTGSSTASLLLGLKQEEQEAGISASQAAEQLQQACKAESVEQITALIEAYPFLHSVAWTGQAGASATAQNRVRAKRRYLYPRSKKNTLNVLSFAEYKPVASDQALLALGLDPLDPT